MVVMEGLVSGLALVLLLHAIVLAAAKSPLLPIVTDDDGDGGRPGEIQTYIVHVQDPEGGELLGAEELERYHRSFLPNATLDTGEPRLLYSYRHAISGFAALLTPEEAQAMEELDGFLYARPEMELSGQTTDSYNFLGLNAVGGLWSTASSGTGMIIAVIDTGVAPAHPSFDDTGMPQRPPQWNRRCWLPQPYACNNKIIGARAFKAAAGRTGLSPVDDNGHGSHTASTAAGSPVPNASVLGQAEGTATGMAPGAHLSIYKVLDANNRGQDIDFLAGIDQAISDGVDVLSMSLGTPRGAAMHRSSIAISSFSAIMNNIVPSCCAMNEGPTPWLISNDAPWCLTVGASTMARRIQARVVLGNGMQIDGESAYQPDTFDSSVQLPLVYPGDFYQTDDAYNCMPGWIIPADVQGKIVMCTFGGQISQTNKGAVVKAAGGAAMILINRNSLGSTTFSDPHALPAAHIGFADAGKVESYYKTAQNPTATIEFNRKQPTAGPTPAVAAFSSRGPSPYNGGIIKPDVIAPGVNILAAWPFQIGPNPTGGADFNFDSGTSMATPHVSGIAAMLKKNHPSWSPAMIKSALMTTAFVVDDRGNRITDQATNGEASFFAMGSGHVDPNKANDPGLVYDTQPADYYPYLCGLYNRHSATVTIIVRVRVDCSTVQVIGAEQLNYPSVAVVLGPGNWIDVLRTATNVENGASDYTVRVDPPSGVSVDVQPRVLSFSAVNERRSFVVRITNQNRGPGYGAVSEGFFTWVSADAKHTVKSPISVTFK